MINSKRKGNQGERDFAKFLREQNLDKKAWRNYGSGSTSYKSDVVNKLGYNFEVKVGKHFNLLGAIQTSRDAEMAHTTPSVVFHLDKMRDGEWWIILPADEWSELFKKDSEPRVKEPDKNLRWKLETLKNVINQVIKELK